MLPEDKEAFIESSPKAEQPNGPARLDAAIAAALGSISFALYAVTACPTVYWKDSAEYSWVAPSGGILHSSGYPLFSMAARLWCSLPVGEPAYMMNLLSGLFGSATLVLLFLWLRRQGVSAFVSFTVSLHLGLTGEMWNNATAAEVYTLHTMFLAGSILVTSARLEPVKRLALLALVCGLSFSNHMTTFLWAPFLLALSWPDVVYALASKRLRNAGFIALCFAAGFWPYIYTYLSAGPNNPFNQGDPSTVPRLLEHIAGTQAWGRTFLTDTAVLWKHFYTDLSGLATRGTPMGLAAACIGLWALGRTGRTRLLVAFALLALPVFAFALFYETSDRAWCLLPVDLAMAAVAGFGFQTLADTGALKRRYVFLLAALLPATTMGWRVAMGETGKGDELSLFDYASAVSKEVPEGSIVLFRDLNVYHAVQYLRYFGKLGKDLVPVAEYLLPYQWYIEQLARDHPDLRGLDAALKVARGGSRELSRIDPMERGSVYLELIEAQEKTLISANLGKRRVFFLPYRDRDRQRLHYGFASIFRGLCYELIDSNAAWAGNGPMRDDPDTPLSHLPGPAAHTSRDPHARAVARRYAFAFNYRGVLRAEAGMFQKAAKDFKTALKYDPGFKNPYLNLASVYVKEGRTLQVVRAVLQACSKLAGCTGDDADLVLRQGR